LLLAIILAAAGVASGQGPRSADAEHVRTRQKIFMMEGMLERAVQLGVENLRRRARAVMPDDALLQGGAPQARGFRLEGYGTFFDVEVPTLRRSLVWSLRTMNETGSALARDIAQMRAFVEAIADPRVRAEFERTLQRLQRQIAPAAGTRTVSTQASPGVPAESQSGVVVSSAVPAEADPVLLNDPSEAYTQEVRASLIEAMIENSGVLIVDAEEWLTVAARDNAPADPFTPGDQQTLTLVLRIKGSDLAAFRAGRLTLDEARARVQISQF
jgi:hypothetical protein